jgi:hypothetical protein
MTSPLSQPLTPQTLDELIASYTNADNIAAEKDPLKRLLMVSMGYASEQANTLQIQNDETKQTTDELANLNQLSTYMNDAAGRTEPQADTDTTWVGPQWMSTSSDPLTSSNFDPNTAEDLKQNLAANGVDPNTMSIYVWQQGYPGAEPPDQPVHVAEVRMAKKDIAEASKNLALKVDTLSSTAQQAQTYEQMQVGRYTATLELATKAAEDEKELTVDISRNFRT